MKLRVGQIGIGAWGQFHCKLLSELPGINLVGIYDINPATGLHFSKVYHTNVYQSFESLIEDIDALILTAPTSEHFRIAKHALMNDVHVFVEKPICVRVDQASRLMEISQGKNLVLQVGHIERFNPAFQAIQSQKFMPYYVESYRMAPFSPRGTDVSVVLDLMVHDIDLILKIIDQPVKSIDALGINVVSKYVDFANAKILFENGCVANLTASRVAADKIRQLVFYQEGERFTLDFLNRKTMKSCFDSEMKNGESDIELTAPNASVNPLKEELLAFVNAINEKQIPIVDGNDGTEALRVALEIDKRITANSIHVQPELRLADSAADKKPLKY